MIVVFGSINADLCFELERCPDPGETLASKHFSLGAGGKGANQAVAAALDGAEVMMIGAVGEDALAATALANLETAGVDVTGVKRSASQTGCAAILVEDSGENRIVLDAGANGTVSSTQLDFPALEQASCIVLQLEVPVAETVAAIETASRLGVKTILNLAPAARLPRVILEKVTVLVVNESEAMMLAAMLGTSADAASIGTALGNQVVRTLGASGAEAFSEGNLVTYKGHRVDVVDTTAAGDCFIGVLAAGLDRKLTLHDALPRAIAASALACTKAGSQSALPTHKDINA
ncbi:ribokinase [Marivita sp. S6314]|uniref:ribokinase n=1 Tax=Marivita sp. S6314 TaxID=2926406 RepID=UPI001FF32ADC|nr:ribokinase [Marivita sp. S6314]MCK0150658.1 ribokinase [Marivita sp. S6314]